MVAFSLLSAGHKKTVPFAPFEIMYSTFRQPYVEKNVVDDHEERNCIAAIAKQRGEAILKRTLSGDEIVVIGDTPLDISCAQSIGARVLAVGTGEYKKDQLMEYKPTWSVEDVRQIDADTLLGRTPAEPISAKHI